MQPENKNEDFNPFPEMGSEKEFKKSIEKAVEGMEMTPEKALENKKSEIGEKAFGEYRKLFDRKKNLEERLSLEETAETLKEAKEKSGERNDARKELDEINKRINFLRKNENFSKINDLESKIPTLPLGEGLNDAMNELEGAKAGLGNDIMERIRDLEKTRRDAYKERDEKKKEIQDLQNKGELIGLGEINKIRKLEKRINEISKILEREDLLGFLEEEGSGEESEVPEGETTDQLSDETDGARPEDGTPEDKTKKKEANKVGRFIKGFGKGALILLIVGQAKLIWNYIKKVIGLEKKEKK